MPTGLREIITMSNFEGAVAIGASWPPPDSTDDDLTTAQWIGGFNTELIAAEVPESAREFALQQAIFAYFQRSGVILAKKADA